MSEINTIKTPSEMLVKMIVDFMEIRRSIMNFSHKIALKAVKNSLTEYRKFKNRQTTPELDEILDQVIKTVFAGLRLIMYFLKVSLHEILNDDTYK